MNRTSGMLFASVAASISLASCTQAPWTSVPLVEGPTDATSTITTTITPDVTATPATGEVAALLQDPPKPMESVEINAYHGEGYESWPGRGRFESMSGCPSADSSPLTDHPLWLTLRFSGHSSSNPIPDGAPWLIAAQIGDTPFPELPRFARLRGHLGDPAFAHCPEADRIFAVEDIVETYEEKREFTYSQADYGRWRQYSDPLGRFRLAYPPDWAITASSDDLITLRSEQWPDSPVTVRVIEGTFNPTALPGDVDVQTWADQFPHRPPDVFVTSNVPVLWGDERFCAGGLPDGCVEVIFSHAGNDYVFRHEYPTGFDAHPATLWTFQHIAESFWIEGRATVTPTPTANTILGDGPFWTREQAEEMALSMIPFGPWSVTDARLITEAEALRLNLCAMRRDDPNNMWYTFPEGVWVIEMTGNFDGRNTVYYTYLDAQIGQHVCTAEKGTRQGAGSLPTGTPAPPS